MTPAPFPSKYRAKFSRNKTGCLGCRARRKKCDGTKPVCSPCLRREGECHWPATMQSDNAPSTLRASPVAGVQATPAKVDELQDTKNHTDDDLPNSSMEGLAHIRSTPLIFPRMPSCSTLLSPSATRQQMRATAADLFGPDVAFRRFSPYWRMLQCSADEQDAFTLALDTLTLSQLGVAFRDKRLLNHATRTHFHAVRKLQAEIRQAAALASVTDTTLSTPYLLYLCQRFTPIATLTGEVDIPIHLLGLSQLLSISNAEVSDIHHLLVDDCQLYALEWSMIYRQKLDWTLPKTTFTAAESIPFRCPRFTEHMMKAPDYLSEADQLLSTKMQPHDREHLLKQCYTFLGELQRYERDLMSLFHSWMEASSSCGFDIVDAASLPSRDAQLDALSESVFGIAFSFSSFAHACMHKRFWQCVHFIRDIADRVRLAILGPSSQSSDVSQNTSIVADNICRAVIFICSKVENGSHGYYNSKGPLKLLRPWYDARGLSEKVAWCDALEQFLHEKGMYTGRSKPLLKL